MPKLLVVTVASTIEPGFRIFRESCARHGIEPVVLGMGKPFRHNIDKIRFLHEFLITGQHDCSHILFSDAYDVVFAAGPDRLLETYYSFNSPLVFSTERNCYPNSELANRYERNSTVYPFLNAGLWMGDAAAVTNLVENVVSASDCRCDQLACTLAFLSGKFPIVLDHECRLFQCLYKSESDLEWKDAGQIRNVLTRQAPLVFHGNGCSNMHFVLTRFKLVPTFQEAFISAVRFGLMSENQYQFIIESIACSSERRTLVIGAGHDMALWYQCSKGNLLWVGNRGGWLHEFPCRTIFPRYAGRVGLWLEEINVPKRIKSIAWDIVIIDGFEGFCPCDPGCQEPIAWAASLTKGIVLVHRYERDWENRICEYYLGKPFKLVPSENGCGRMLAAFDRAKVL